MSTIDRRGLLGLMLGGAAIAAGIGAGTASALAAELPQADLPKLEPLQMSEESGLEQTRWYRRRRRRRIVCWRNRWGRRVCRRRW